MTSTFFMVFAALTLGGKAGAEPSILERLAGPTTGAHRGGMVWATAGNTMDRFQYALDAGIDMIELDLHVSKDGVPVVIHADLLENSTTCKGLVESLTLAELKKCRIHYTLSTRIPTFEEVLVWNQGRVVINAEFKVDGAIVPALDLVRKYDAYESVFFQTRTERAKYFAARAYDKNVALLYKILSLEDLKWADDLRDPRLVVIEVDKDMTLPHVVDAIHATGKVALSNAFRFDTLREFGGANCDKLFAIGVDIANSDNPPSCVAQKIRWLERLGAAAPTYVGPNAGWEVINR